MALATIIKDERWRTLIPDMATVISWKDGTVMVRRVQPSLTCSTTAGGTEKGKAQHAHTSFTKAQCNLCYLNFNYPNILMIQTLCHGLCTNAHANK